jgi:hypothetical protein
MLGVACHERPTRVVGQKLEGANGSHALTPHRIALIPNGSKVAAVSPRTTRWCSQNLMRAWWATLSKVSSRSSPQAVVNQVIMVGSVG